ncbi:hypothetical protein [Streptomyces brasiliscabiei]|uniref:hypothetical protein n=1 Tax=Streptomyces brasiliscabiei TaxID=2736302 RepID=UPI001C100B49|nr:hypothetical protein [Streptomyces brasiliscabiei]
MMEVFTPLNSDRTQRLVIPMDEVIVLSGSLDTREVGKKAVVSIKGKTFDVIGIPCDLLRCNCDAAIKEVM